MPIAELTQVREPSVRWKDVAALAEPRLHDDRRDLGRRDEALEHHLVQVVEVAVERVVHAREHRPEVRAVLRFRCRQRDASHRASVERLEHADQVLTAGGEARELDRRLNRLGARVRQERSSRAAAERRHLIQPFTYLRIGREEEVARRVMEQLGRLTVDGVNHRRVAVSGRRHRDPRVQIQEDVAVDVLHDGAGPPLRNGRVCPREGRGRDLAVPLDPCECFRSGDLGDQLGSDERREPVVGEPGLPGAHSAITVRDCSRRYCIT